MEGTYRNDAYRFAYARLRQINSPFKDSINIPSLYADTVARALYAIENMAWTPLKDTILNLFGFRDFDTANTAYNTFEADSLHTYNVGSNDLQGYMKSIRVSVSGSLATEWAAHNYYNTSDAAMNNLLAAYGFTIRPANPLLPGKPYYIVSFPKAYNTSAVLARFSATTNISSAYLNPIVGDHNFVLADYEADGLQLTYRNGCGDCPAGCTWATMWFFKVFYSNCSVQYLGRTPLVDGETAYQRVCSRGTVMPLKLTSFKAFSDKENVRLVWETQSEQNTSHFLLQRSENGVTFPNIDEITAAGNSSGTRLYSTVDYAPFAKNKMLYYRLKMIDKDGNLPLAM